MKILALTCLVALTAACSTTAVAATAAPTTRGAECLSGPNGSIVVGVERHINGMRWAALNMCCTTTGACTWTNPRHETQTLTATVKPVTGRSGVYAVTVPGHSCMVTTNLQPGSAGTFRQRCVKA